MMNAVLGKLSKRSLNEVIAKSKEKKRQLKCILGLLGLEVKIYAAIYFVLLLCKLYVQGKAIIIYGDLVDALEKKDSVLFRQVFTNTVLFTMYKPAVEAVFELCEEYMTVGLTSKLCSILLRKYILEKVYYEICFNANEVDVRKFKENTVQKALRNDVKALFKSFKDTMENILFPIVKLITIFYVISSIVSFQGVMITVAVLFVFSVAEVYLVFQVDKKNDEIEKHESVIHELISRLALHAEEIAFWKSEKLELQRMEKKLRLMYMNLLKSTQLRLTHVFIDELECGFYTYAGYFLFYDLYFIGTVSLADLQKINHALRSMMIASWRLRVKGVSVLATINQRTEPVYFLAKPRPALVKYVRPIENVSSSLGPSVLLLVKNLSVRRYGCDEYLVKDLNLVIGKGDRLLITGGNGVGKTTLFRVFANLLPEQYLSTDAEIRCIPSHLVMFLSQKTFLIPDVTIKEQLLYPTWSREQLMDQDSKKLGIAGTKPKKDGEESNSERPFIALSSQITMPVPSDDEIKDVLRAVGLEDRMKLMSDTKELDIDAKLSDWNLFSGGEKEMLSFGRVLLAKPKLVFLDEVTAGLAEPVEKQLYEKLCEHTDITYVSIGHRNSLHQFHNRKLTFTSEKKYKLSSI